jgi:hypothetical protein
MVYEKKIRQNKIKSTNAESVARPYGGAFFVAYVLCQQQG